MLNMWMQIQLGLQLITKDIRNKQEDSENESYLSIANIVLMN